MSNVTECATASYKGLIISTSSSLVRTAKFLSEESLWPNNNLVEGFFCRLFSRDPYRNNLIFNLLEYFFIEEEDFSEIIYSLSSYFLFPSLSVSTDATIVLCVVRPIYISDFQYLINTNFINYLKIKRLQNREYFTSMSLVLSVYRRVQELSVSVKPN